MNADEHYAHVMALKAARAAQIREELGYDDTLPEDPERRAVSPDAWWVTSLGSHR